MVDIRQASLFDEAREPVAKLAKIAVGASLELRCSSMCSPRD